MQDTEYRLQKVNLMYEAKHETAMNHNATMQRKGSPTTEKDEGMKGLLVTLVTCHLSN
jgi:hypothetical protein